MEKMPVAAPRSSGRKVSYRIAWDVGSSAPPPIPWIKRNRTSVQMLSARPQSSEAKVKRRMEPMK